MPQLRFPTKSVLKTLILKKNQILISDVDFIDTIVLLAFDFTYYQCFKPFLHVCFNLNG